VDGDLWIGGIGVARGYLNRPELTAERFVPNPFAPGQIYRTGDRARWREDGKLEFLGRDDLQLKIHGVRVEASEVQEALTRQPEIAAAVVGMRGQGSAKALVAWVIAREPVPNAAVLRRRLAKVLPSPVIPSAFVTVAQFPVTTSGKLDLASLPDSENDIASNTAARRAPATLAEQEMFVLWRETIDIPAIRDGKFGVDDDLFDLGADSLTAVRLTMKMGVRYGVSLPTGLFEGTATVAALARALTDLLANQRPDGAPPSGNSNVAELMLIRSARGVSRGAVVGMPAYDGSVTVSAVIAANAFDNYDFWAFSADPSHGDLRQGLTALRQARAFADTLSSERGFRLSAIVGFSFGGFLAWLTDRALVEKGFPATPVINLEGYVSTAATEPWREKLADLLAAGGHGKPGRMLLVQRVSPIYCERAVLAETAWRSMGVDVFTLGCRTLNHSDLEMPGAIRAARDQISNFVEMERAIAQRELLLFEFDSFGGRLFRLADGAMSPTATELRALLSETADIPPDGAVLRALYTLAAGTGDVDLLDNVTTRIANDHSESAAIRAELGDAWVQMGDFVRAEREYRAAISIAPRRAMFHEKLAHAQACACRYEDALQALREAFGLGGNDPSIYIHVGDIFSARGEKAVAEWAYRAAIEIAPQHSEAHVALARLLNAVH
jgi:tetratricopeptide (TPR) repeat protein/acyl carrier protein